MIALPHRALAIVLVAFSIAQPGSRWRHLLRRNLDKPRRLDRKRIRARIPIFGRSWRRHCDRLLPFCPKDRHRIAILHPHPRRVATV